jgi:hypothetical protein
LAATPGEWLDAVTDTVLAITSTTKSAVVKQRIKGRLLLQGNQLWSDNVYVA